MESLVEAFMRAVKDNPRFVEAPATGRAVTIGGARPTAGELPAEHGEVSAPAVPPGETSGEG
jgi:hypothetical protein